PRDDRAPIPVPTRRSSDLSQSQTEEAVAALEGLDPVMLVQGKEVQGSLKIAVTRGGFQYFFANEEDKATFEKEPAHYEIQLNGIDRKSTRLNSSHEWISYA